MITKRPSVPPIVSWIYFGVHHCCGMVCHFLFIVLAFLLKAGCGSPCGRKECDTCIEAAKTIPHWDGDSVPCNFYFDDSLVIKQFVLSMQ